MINFFTNLNKIIKTPLYLIIYILNFTVLSCIIFYTILFYLGLKNLFLSNLIIIFSLITLSLKLLYWTLIKDFLTLGKNKSKLILLRVAFCTFTYLTPAYYVFKQESLVMNDDIISITLIIISIIACIGMIIERYLLFIESKLTVSSYYENELI